MSLRSDFKSELKVFYTPVTLASTLLPLFTVHFSSWKKLHFQVDENSTPPPTFPSLLIYSLVL